MLPCVCARVCAFACVCVCVCVCMRDHRRPYRFLHSCACAGPKWVRGQALRKAADTPVGYHPEFRRLAAQNVQLLLDLTVPLPPPSPTHPPQLRP